MRSKSLKGSNLTTVRGINERLILHLLRKHGALSKAEATRMTGLSANAVSVIFRALENEGLLLRGSPVRGRIGQPSVPMRLNPDARYYLGYKIGRRSVDLVVVNFVGDALALASAVHDYPTPANVLQFLEDNLPRLLVSANLTESCVSALNIAMPFELWNWIPDFDAPAEKMNEWRTFDLKAEIKCRVPWPVTLQNDGTAACRAELIFGPPLEEQDFVYLFVGTFIGGGVVLNGGVFMGRRGNAGAFAPMRIPDEPAGERLIDHASLVVLERMVARRDPQLARTLYTQGVDWALFEPELSLWLPRAGRSMAHAIVSALSVFDFETVVIDGALPAPVLSRLVRKVSSSLDIMDLQGVERPDLKIGHFSYTARAKGAAAFQISRDYMIDQNTLLRETPTTIFKS